MFRTLSRLILPNRLDWICRRAKHRQAKRFLLCWNRGLGDIALGLYAIVHRIREWIPEAEITFLIRPDLQEGFTLFPSVRAIPTADLVRGKPYEVRQLLAALQRREKEFDVIIAHPSPTDWVRWQRGTLVPRLTWNEAYEDLYQTFSLSDQWNYVGVQLSLGTNHSLWREWPMEKWVELLERLGQHKNVRVILFGTPSNQQITGDHIIDLRGKTSLFQLLSIIKHRCQQLILIDSAILSLVYYLDCSFPIRVISLFANQNHGVLKQNVCSPNPLLVHCPIIAPDGDLRQLSVDEVWKEIL